MPIPEKLLPCPFCGGEELSLIADYEKDQSCPQPRVCCTNCEATVGGFGSTILARFENAVSQWQRRSGKEVPTSQ